MRWTVLAASLWLASAAQAGTLLFLNSQAGDYIGQGADLLITSADGTFTASRNFDNGVNVDFSGNTPGDFWSADFAAPTNATLVPGAYEAPRAGRSRRRALRASTFTARAEAAKCSAGA